MLFSITSLYASLLVFILVFLSVRTVRLRFSEKISIGDRGNKVLQVAIRAQANFVEYVPLSILLLVIFESNYGSSIYVHILGAALCVSRVMHAWGFITARGGASNSRALGILVNWMVLVILALLNLMFYFGQLFQQGY